MEAASEKAMVYESLTAVREDETHWENEQTWASVFQRKHRDPQAELKSNECGEKFTTEDC